MGFFNILIIFLKELIRVFSYLFGEEVDGTAFGVFGVIYKGKKHSFPSSLQRVEVTTHHLYNDAFLM